MMVPSYHFEYQTYLEQLIPLFKKLESIANLTPRDLTKIVHASAKHNGKIFAKDELVQAYQQLAGTHGLQPRQAKIADILKMKPTRTMSGVTPVTVLTKPFPCPGTCIFCPNDIRMPKSYLADEPGAQRAERNFFDPYLQTYNRLQAFYNIGHSTDKVEIIVLGGTWSYYPEAYQIWFITECFRALNDFQVRDSRPEIMQQYQKMEAEYHKQQQHAPSADPAQNQAQLHSRIISGQQLDKTYNQVVSELYVAPERLAGFDAYQSATWSELEAQQKINQTARYRNVGLVIETRPDNISQAEVLRIRRLGCTKAQIGFQSLNDSVLAKNKRGHDVAATRRAVNLLRQAGFKIHAHWMANLYGSSVAEDKADFVKLFSDSDFMPDELKIYPCSLIESAELMQYFKRGQWQPYSYAELLDILTFCLRQTPQYCRLTRVIRDIPSTDIVEGNKLTNFRQIAELALAEAGQFSQDIRAREIKGQKVTVDDLELQELEYQTSVSQEIFLQYVVKADPKSPQPQKIVAFLRLSLPTVPNFVPELADAAIIREVHVYGQAVAVGDKKAGKAQHLGLGSLLLDRAKALAQKNGFKKLAVISAIGTREYYQRRGFETVEMYQFCDLK